VHSRDVRPLHTEWTTAGPWRTARLSSFPKVKGAAPRVPRSRLVQHFHLAVIF
jgi:hypothetical protein